MKLEVWTLQKTTESYLKDGIAIYIKKIQPYFNGFNYKELSFAASKKTEQIDKLLLLEEAEILKNLDPLDYLILLDDKGKSYTSIELSNYLRKRLDSGSGKLILLIGGPFGFSENIKKRASDLLSLSQLTFTHQMVRLILLEQIYRAGTIQRGEPYHHE